MTDKTTPKRKVPRLTQAVLDLLKEAAAASKAGKEKTKGTWAAMVINRRYQVRFFDTYYANAETATKVTPAWIAEAAKSWDDGLIFPVWVPKGCALPA
jgi:hypothetical protein